MKGPLKGKVVIEIAGIGPGPFCAMMLADMGATVIRVDRKSAVSKDAVKGASGFAASDVMNRGRKSIGVDLKSSKGAEVVLRLTERADVLIEGFRPGVAERLGIGPEDAMRRNPKLIYGRMTGWGQDGPYASQAGHDINYIAISGALGAIGRKGEPPVPPLNLVGDFGGGGLMLAFGVACALVESETSGKGQIIDAAMVDGSALLTTFIYGLKAGGFWNEGRGENLLDTGAHFYEVYETKDHKYLSVGSIEPQFYAELKRIASLEEKDFANQMDRNNWPEMKVKLAAIIKTKTRDEWATLFQGSDACVAPVLDFDEARENEHMKARGVFVESAGIVQPSPAPRFSRTPGDISMPPPAPGQHSTLVLEEFGFGEKEIEELKATNIVA